MPPGPTIRRRQLGKELRRLRERAGTSTGAAADWLDVATSTVSKVENGRQAPRVAHVRLLLQLYGVESPESDALLRLAREANQRGWWASYGDTVPDWFRNYVGLEADAERIATYDPELIHGLLQTSDYTRAVTLASRPDLTQEGIDRAAEVRHARQDRLTDENPPHVHAILGEGVLRRVVGGRAVMVTQLKRLTELADRPNITVQVLPFEAGAHPAMVSPFHVLTFPEDTPPAVYLENDRGAVYLERPADIERYTWMHRQLAEQSLSPERSAELAATLVGHLEQGEEVPR